MGKPETINVAIQDNRTGERTKTQTFIVPKPGMVTIWDFKLPFETKMIEVRVDWPLKEKGEKAHGIPANTQIVE